MTLRTLHDFAGLGRNFETLWSHQTIISHPRVRVKRCLNVAINTPASIAHGTKQSLNTNNKSGISRCSLTIHILSEDQRQSHTRWNSVRLEGICQLNKCLQFRNFRFFLNTLITCPRKTDFCLNVIFSGKIMNG